MKRQEPTGFPTIGVNFTARVQMLAADAS
jgi:hypothetical protein